MRRYAAQWVWVVWLLCSTVPLLCEDHYILRSPSGLAQAIADRHRLTVHSPANTEGVSGVINPDNRTPADIVAELTSDADVQNVEIDQRVLIPEAVSGIQLNQSTAVILDTSSIQTPVPYFGGGVWGAYINQPATALIRLSDAQGWSTGSGIVAIIDTGVDPTQPVLVSSLVPGYDFVHDVPGIASEWSDIDPSVLTTLLPAPGTASGQNVVTQLNQSTAVILDQSTAVILDTSLLPAAFGHGTMVAGIVHLVAPTAQIMPLKAFRSDGSASLSDIVHAIYFATDNGAQVINMSFSLSTPSLELAKAINYANAHGVACVASVGNGASEAPVFPAVMHNVVGVASTSSADVRSSFSNFGTAMTQIAAPGEAIVTLYPAGLYAVASGTSFAAPFVTGGFVLLNQVDNDISLSQALDAISSAKRLTPDLGYGRLDLYRALRSVMSH